MTGEPQDTEGAIQVQYERTGRWADTIGCGRGLEVARRGSPSRPSVVAWWRFARAARMWTLQYDYVAFFPCFLRPIGLIRSDPDEFRQIMVRPSDHSQA
jgi:hypothetical protein